MRLLRVELRRLRSRQLIVLTMLGAVLLPLFTLLGVWQSTRPPTDADLAQAEQFYEEQLADWQEHGEQYVADCRAAEAEEAELTGRAADWGCDDMEPQLEWFVHVVPPLHESLIPQLTSFGALPLLAALLIGTTFTAAELSTGSIATWLSFEPRRGRVYGSKVAAAGLGVVPLAVIMMAVVVLGTWAINAQAGLTGGMTTALWAEVVELAARVVGLAVLAAVAGSALGIVLRHSAAVLAGVVLYLVAEQIVAAYLPGARPWLLGLNLVGWIEGGTTYYVETCTTEATGLFCDYTERSLSLGHSLTYVLVATTVVVIVGGLVFRRRDAV